VAPERTQESRPVTLTFQRERAAVTDVGRYT
jgi:hypothetical protein